MAFSEPAENVKNLDLKEGYKIADFGAGSGHYTLAAAKRVHARGQVFAIDVQKDILPKIQSAARDEGVHNVQILWGDVEKPGGSKLRDNMVDVVMITNMLFLSEKKEDIAREALRILRPGGQVMVVDWSDSYGGLGPKSGHVVLEEEAKKIFENVGFKYGKSFYAGDHHWGFVATK
ncbi:MAG TPA: methyltransferase domain-containing protein [Candidatus Paceibacterota bacterium]|nr:methyltransferase domain-containing protein [Candidatus Paceibacterota bacterium]